MTYSEITHMSVFLIIEEDNSLLQFTFVALVNGIIGYDVFTKVSA